MRQLVPVLCALACLACVPVHADRITSDPNMEPKVQEPTALATDPRLDLRITYTATDKRLHTVLEELSARTGVSVRCGKSSNDWQVRDLPVIVCARDLPLGHLLKAIADATHMLLSSSTSEGKRVYRIWRDKSREDELTSFTQGRADALTARAAWEWNAWVAMGSIPDSELRVDAAEFKQRRGLDFGALREFSKIVASLGAAEKKKALEGARVNIRLSDLPQQQTASIRNVCRFYFDMQEGWRRDSVARDPQMAARFAPRAWSDDLFENECLCLNFNPKESEQGLTYSLVGEVNAVDFAGRPTTWAGDFRKYLGDMPPIAAAPPLPPFRCPAGFTALKQDEGAHAPETDTFLDIKGDQSRKWKYGEVVAAAARESGMSVICEDFVSHKRGLTYQSDFGGGGTFRHILSRLTPKTTWYVSTDSKLVIGSRECWPDDHANLAPAALINDLETKLNSSGADLEDVVRLTTLTPGQIKDWVVDSLDMDPLNVWCPEERDIPFWRLYGFLNEQQKALAKSEAGLPLSALDPGCLVQAFGEAARAADRASLMSRVQSALLADPELASEVMGRLRANHPEVYATDTGERAYVDWELLASEAILSFPQLMRCIAVPTDPETIAKLTLQLKWKRVDAWKRRYYMTIQGERVNLRIGELYRVLPAYSPKREAEITAEARNAAGAPSRRQESAPR